MPERTRPLGSPAQATADLLRARGVAAGRWFAGYLVAVGVATGVAVVAMEVAAPSWPLRVAIAAAWAVLFVGASLWAERHAAYPLGAVRLVSIATAVWLALYLVAVGPFVRWQFDTSPAAWTVTGAIMAIPYLVAAAIVRARR